MRRTAGLLLAISVAASLLWCGFSLQAEDNRVSRIPISPPKEMQPPLRPFMRSKLESAHEILESLVARDFSKMAAAAESLRDTSLAAPGIVPAQDFDDEAYDHFRLEFTRQAELLRKMAVEKNLEGAAWVHQNLTSTCIACHSHLKTESR